ARARERPDPQAAGGEVGDRFHFELGGRDLLEGCAGAPGHRASGLRQPQRADAAVDQRRPELTLQRRDDLRYRRLCVVEPLGGSGEGAGFADRLQDAKLPQFHSLAECYQLPIFLAGIERTCESLLPTSTTTRRRTKR